MNNHEKTRLLRHLDDCRRYYQMLLSDADRGSTHINRYSAQEAWDNLEVVYDKLKNMKTED